MSGDRPFLGILLMLGFCALAPLGDSIAKLLGDSLALVVLLLARFAVQAAVLIPLGALMGLPLLLPRRLWRLTVLRTLLHVTGLGAMFLSLRFLPLADAIAIAFVMPFVLLLLGKLILREHVGPHRIGACIAGFAGTLLVIRPNFAEVGPPALLPLIVAVVFALFMLITRAIARAADPIILQSNSGALASALLIAASLLIPADELRLSLPGDAVPLLLALGLLGTVAHLLMTWSLRFAPSATLAPMQYLEIPFATLIGWMIWRDLPDGSAAFGIALTVAAGLYIISRERAIARNSPPAT